MKTKKLAVIGYGGRGSIYGAFALAHPDKFELVAVADNKHLLFAVVGL